MQRVPVGPQGKAGSWNATLNVRQQVCEKIDACDLIKIGGKNIDVVVEYDTHMVQAPGFNARQQFREDTKRITGFNRNRCVCSVLL